MARKHLLLIIALLPLCLAVVFIPVIRIHAMGNISTRPAATSKSSEPAGRVQDNVYLLESFTSVTGLNATTGAALWQFQPGGYITIYSAQANILYVSTDQGLPILYALNTHTGVAVWKFSPNGYLNNTTEPVILNHIVYVTVGSTDFTTTTLYALNAFTGAQLWDFQQKTQSISFVIDHNVLYASTAYPSSVYALDLSSGKQLWHSQSVNATMYVGKVLDGVLYGDAEGGPSSFGLIYAFRTSDGTFLWSFSGGRIIGAAHHIAYLEAGTFANPTTCALNDANASQLWCTPDVPLAVLNGRVYVLTSSGFQVLKGSDGTLLWQAHASYLATIHQVVYAVDTHNAIEALKAANGTLIWHSQTADGGGGMFLVGKDDLYTITTDLATVYVLDANNASLDWRYNAGNQISNVTTANGIAYVATFAGNVYALRTSDGTLLWKH